MRNYDRRVRPRYEPQLPYSPLRNSEFLSGHWLDHRLPLEDEWNEWRDSAERALRELLELWRQQRNRVDKYGDEAGLEEGFIQPALQAIGWKLKYQTILRERGREPDYALFTSDDRLDAALKAGRKSPVFWNHATLVAEAKAWHVSLDRPKGIGAKREYPPEQIERYLDYSHCKYGILTNGRLWRLIPREIGAGKPRFQTYVEVDLPKLLDECTGGLTTHPAFDEFLRFYLLFNPRAFETIAGHPPLIDRAVRGSSEYRVGVGEDLKERVFEALRLCIEGFINLSSNKLTSHRDIGTCREQSFILLYRLLFIMYAEDRGLLPYRKNRLYTTNLSLGRLRDDIEDRLNQIAEGRDDPYSNGATDIWDDLLGLFDFIDGGSQRHDIPPYNGGLFDANQNTFLAEKKLADRCIAKVIDQLGRAQDRAHRDNVLVRVDYRDLSIQHLGSIYEGLLELQPRYAPKEMVVHLETDEGERRGSGSYYTPDYVVDYIVKNTLGPICAELDQCLRAEITAAEGHVKRFRGQNRIAYEEKLTKLRSTFGDRVLQLRVLDPAMGSGHFLVRACEYLAEEIATNPNALDPHSDNIKGDDSTLTYWKRRVVESCIFGVDINPLAVELAKLALWLDTVAIDEPLTFLDHHLRTGNSLVGGRVSELGVMPDALPLERNAFENQLEQRLPTLLQPLFDIRRMPSLTSAQIKEKDRLYRKVFQPLSDAFKAVADLWCSVFFVDAKAQILPDQYQGALDSLRDPATARRLAKAEWFAQAVVAARKVSCFHWELEFPEVFFDKHGRRDEGGFDAVIGNPPYLNIRLLTQVQTEAVKKYFGRRFKCAYRGYDLYILFIEQSYRMLCSDGIFGMIVPNKLGTLDYAERCRELLLGATTLHSIADVSKLRVFSSASVYPYVVVYQKRTPTPDHYIEVITPELIQDLASSSRVERLRQSSLTSVSGFAIHGVLNVEERVPTVQLGEIANLDSGTTGFVAQKMAAELAERDSVRDPFFDFIVSGNIDRYSVQLGSVRFMKHSFNYPVLPKQCTLLTKRKLTLFENAKIVIAGMTRRLEAGLDGGGLALGVQVFAVSQTQTDYRYLLAILNSKLMSHLFRIRFQAKHLAGGFLAINKGQLTLLPIRTIAFSNKSDEGKHDRLVDLVQRMLDLQKKLAAAKTPSDQTAIQRQIDATDRQIDQLVYELYGLTDDEIRIVEEATRK